MHLLFLTFTYYPDLGAGSFRSKALIDNLIKKIGPNDKIELITTYPSRYERYFVENIEIKNNENLIIHRIKLPNYFNNNLRMIINFIYYFYKSISITRKKNFDIVFATSSRLMTGVLGAVISKKNNSEYYLDIRDIFLLGVSDLYPKIINFFLYPILLKMEKFMINTADTVNLISEGFIPYFIDKYPKKNYNYFTNGIDEEFLNLNNSKVNTDKNRQIEILYAGNVGEGQGLSKIIPELAMSLENKAIIKIIGDGSDLDKLKKRTKNLNNVKIVNPMSREKLIQHYKTTDILFLHLNKFETFKTVLPSKIFEYAAIGKPILAGVSGYAKKFLEKEIYNSYIFEPCDVKNAYEKFNKINLKFADRNNFVLKFSRNKISENMSNEILSLNENYKQ